MSKKKRQIRVNVKRLNAALKKSGLTKADIARQGDFGYNTVMNIFRGRVQWIRIDSMERLCQLLDITPQEFFEYGKPQEG